MTTEGSVSVSQLKTSPAKVLRALGRRKKPLIVTRRGKPVAALVSLSDLEGWMETEEILSTAPNLPSNIEKNRRDWAQGKLKTLKDVDGELGR
jgi:prevent-host-death family protein